MSNHWTQVNWKRYVRVDGAVVMWDSRSPYPNPANESARMWTAWEPDPSQKFVSMTNGRLTWPRRWRTPEAAMKHVDLAFPLLAETTVNIESQPSVTHS